MPELPEVETIRRDLTRVLRGKTIARVVVRRKKVIKSNTQQFARQLRGRKIRSIERRGKLLIFSFDAKETFLLMHLKMTGQLIYQKRRTFIAGGHPVPRPEKLPSKHTHVVFNFSDGGILFFNDLRQFGYLKLVDRATKNAVVATYGIEPLTRSFTYPAFAAALGARHAPLKNVLLDQTAIAGLGNIYVDEACFFAQVRPTRRAHKLTAAETKKLYRACQEIIRRALKHRGTTFGHYRDGLGEKGNYVWHLKVYGRGGLECLRCHTAMLRKVKVAGRGTVYCAYCQT